MRQRRAPSATGSTDRRGRDSAAAAEIHPTPDWYSTHAAPFCARASAIEMEPARQRFLRHVRAGGRILDVGCGSGRDSLRFHELGYEIDVRDRSPAIAEEARRRTGLAVRVEDVLELQDEAAFEGIWASAMLIHFDEPEFLEAVRRLLRALRPGGALYISLKQHEFASAGDARVPVLDDGRGARGDLRRADAARARRRLGVGGRGGEGARGRGGEGARGRGGEGARWVNMVGKRAVEPAS